MVTVFFIFPARGQCFCLPSFMSCATTGCNIIDHVKTQTPYALCFAGASMVLYVIAGFLLCVPIKQAPADRIGPPGPVFPFYV